LGEGVKENKAEGLKWVFIASEISHSEHDRELRDAMIDETNPTQFEEGKTRAIKWLQEHSLAL
jgi:hypothetical protein